MQLKVHADIGHLSRKHLNYLNHLSSALWTGESSERRRLTYGNWVDHYQFESHINQADFSTLPYHWRHYVETDTIPQALDAAQAAYTHGKPLVVFNSGDHAANLPFNNAILFESSGYRSRSGFRFHSAQPTPLPDYMNVYCNGKHKPRSKREIPVIGFCGKTNTSIYQSIYRWLSLTRRQMMYRCGLFKWEPPPFEIGTFRLKVIRAFKHQPGIATNYILRENFWAGQLTDRSLHHPARIEFINNILDSDYTLCMRGAGNYSFRFYETLCLGRMPIFIDTDCVLPFQDEIDYKSYFPWIKVADLPNAAEIIREFHAALSPQDFIEKQQYCRKLWQDHLTIDGFHQDFSTKIRTLI